MRLINRLGTICSVLFLLLALTSVARSQRARESEPWKAVERFCGWDFEGARLASAQMHFADAVAMLYGSIDWPDEPVNIVSGYRVVSAKVEGDHGKVQVNYQLLAEIRGALQSNGLTVSRRQQTIWVPVIRAENKWKIDATKLTPHVSVDAMRAHIEQIRRDDDEAGKHHRDELLETLISELSDLKAEPGATGVQKHPPSQN